MKRLSPVELQNREAYSAFEVLGVRFAAVQIPDVIGTIETWINNRSRTHYICASNVHSVVESQRNAELREALNSSDLNVPDGMPIVWLGRSRGHRLPRRVYGPDLFLEFCRETHRKRYRHFFYGSTPEVLAMLEMNLRKQFPEMQIVGSFAPPFRKMTEEEAQEAVELIHTARPDVVWVGLGCPKQELWMRMHREQLQVPAVIGIGQAFNIFAGTARQAPGWMREHGLEWLFRLSQEPRRLWQRYLLYNTEFILRLVMQVIPFQRLSSTGPRS